MITNRQGLLIPNDWKYDAGKSYLTGKCAVQGHLCHGLDRSDVELRISGLSVIRGMPAIRLEHPEQSDYCHVSVRWLPSLGKLSYKRTIKYRFLKNADYNDLCKYIGLTRRRMHCLLR